MDRTSRHQPEADVRGLHLDCGGGLGGDPRAGPCSGPTIGGERSGRTLSSPLAARLVEPGTDRLVGHSGNDACRGDGLPLRIAAWASSLNIPTAEERFLACVADESDQEPIA